MNGKSQRYGQAVAPRQYEPHDGVVLIDKPAGPTSHDVVDAIRHVLGIRKVGHGGTLDPAATGLLIILTGRGTKLSNHFLGSDKVYDGTLALGKTTSTQDGQGEVLNEMDCSGVTEEQVMARMKAHLGDQMQTPPMVSAVKVDGVPLYKRARKGQTVERKARLIHVYDFKMSAFHHPEADFSVRCTKGTYIRTLCADIGEELGCGAYLKLLRRTRCGDLSVEDAIRLEDVLALDHAAFIKRVIPMARFAHVRS